MSLDTAAWNCPEDFAVALTLSGFFLEKEKNSKKGHFFPCGGGDFSAIMFIESQRNSAI